MHLDQFHGINEVNRLNHKKKVMRQNILPNMTSFKERCQHIHSGMVKERVTDQNQLVHRIIML